MHQMAKGANIALSSVTEASGPITLTLGWTDPTVTGEADVSVLPLNADGKVSSDEDFFFYNHPASRDGSVHLLGKSPTGSGGEDRILLDLGALPAEVERVSMAAPIPSDHLGPRCIPADDALIGLGGGADAVGRSPDRVLPGSWSKLGAAMDDSFGMDQPGLRHAMRFARDPSSLRSPRDLSRFGLGLKTVSLSHARRLTVMSHGRPPPRTLKAHGLSVRRDHA